MTTSNGVKLVIIVVGGSLLLMTVFLFVSSDNQAAGGKIEITPLQYDAGQVSMAAGLVKKTFEIKNAGEEDLKINEIRTSCDCTIAILRIEDKISPEFGMHSNSALWSEKIAPGETGFLEVIFDPAYHGPQGVGDVVRAVYISNSDPNNKTAEVRLLAKVVQ